MVAVRVGVTVTRGLGVKGQGPFGGAAPPSRGEIERLSERVAALEDDLNRQLRFSEVICRGASGMRNRSWVRAWC